MQISQNDQSQIDQYDLIAIKKTIKKQELEISFLKNVDSALSTVINRIENIKDKDFIL